jgi:hypothetical protein
MRSDNANSDAPRRANRENSVFDRRRRRGDRAALQAAKGFPSQLKVELVQWRRSDGGDRIKERLHGDFHEGGLVGHGFRRSAGGGLSACDRRASLVR